jgi:hypothetical protein
MHYILVAEFCDFETAVIRRLLEDYVRDGRVSRIVGLDMELWVYEDIANRDTKLTITGFWPVFEYCSQRAGMLPPDRADRVLGLCREVHSQEYGALNRRLCRGGWVDSSSSRSTCADVLLRARLDCDDNLAAAKSFRKKFHLMRFWREEPLLRELRAERWRKARQGLAPEPKK